MDHLLVWRAQQQLQQVEQRALLQLLGQPHGQVLQLTGLVMAASLHELLGPANGTLLLDIA